MLLSSSLVNTQAQTTAHFGIDPYVGCCYCIDYVIRSGCGGSTTNTGNDIGVCETEDIPLASGEVIYGIKVYAPNCTTLLWEWYCSTGTSGTPICGSTPINFAGDETTGFRLWP